MCVISGLSEVSQHGEWNAGRQGKVHTDSNQNIIKFYLFTKCNMQQQQSSSTSFVTQINFLQYCNTPVVIVCNKIKYMI